MTKGQIIYQDHSEGLSEAAGVLEVFEVFEVLEVCPVRRIDKDWRTGGAGSD